MKVNMTRNPNIKIFDDARCHVELEDEHLESTRSFDQAYVTEFNSFLDPIAIRTRGYSRKPSQSSRKLKNMVDTKRTSNQSCYSCGKLGYYVF